MMNDFDDSAQPIHVEAGETFALALTGNPTTGYTWQADVDEAHLALLGQEFKAGGGGVGYDRILWSRSEGDRVRFVETVERLRAVLAEPLPGAIMYSASGDSVICTVSSDSTVESSTGARSMCAWLSPWLPMPSSGRASQRTTWFGDRCQTT